MSHHCIRHQPRTRARHRRTTILDHARRIATICALAAAVIGMLYAVPEPAGANTATATNTASSGATVKRMDYGSGTLGTWTTLTHGTVGDILDSQYDGDPQADVLLVGDSITTRTYSDFIARIQAAGHTAAVNYWSGRPTAPAVDWVLSLTNKPKVIAMATGSNDVMDPTVMTTQIKRLKAGLPETTMLLWVDVQVSRPAFALADQRNSMAVNQQIYEQMGDAGAIGWAELFWSAPWRLGYYLADGVHPRLPEDPNGGDGIAFRNAAIVPKILAALG